MPVATFYILSLSRPVVSVPERFELPSVIRSRIFARPLDPRPPRGDDPSPSLTRAHHAFPRPSADRFLGRHTCAPSFAAVFRTSGGREAYRSGNEPRSLFRIVCAGRQRVTAVCSFDACILDRRIRTRVPLDFGFGGIPEFERFDGHSRKTNAFLARTRTPEDITDGRTAPNERPRVSRSLRFYGICASTYTVVIFRDGRNNNVSLNGP